MKSYRKIIDYEEKRDEVILEDIKKEVEKEDGVL